MNNNKKGKKIGFCGKFYIFAPLINCFAMRALPWLGNLTFRQFGIEFLDNKKFIVNYKYIQYDLFHTLFQKINEVHIESTFWDLSAYLVLFLTTYYNFRQANSNILHRYLHNKLLCHDNNWILDGLKLIFSSTKRCRGLGNLISKLFWPTKRKNWSRRTFKIGGWKSTN